MKLPSTTITDFELALAEGNRRYRSWREKLNFVCDLFADEARPLSLSEWVDLAVYLRFLATGEIACAEDGRHFRPGHHARTSSLIQDRLANLTTEDNALSRISPAECQAIASEMEACRQNCARAERESLLRLKAAIERAQRLAEDFSDQILTLFPPRAQALGFAGAGQSRWPIAARGLFH